ncbi:hypothetical protein [Dyadobacter endophyticus]|uniref:hypothetical protein n=1 Tax=Dyadobacter endophyticus TaxID=1749036 RepID=UPI00166E0B31|nr:hypothetical protein [Dyadobacter endophyticus]
MRASFGFSGHGTGDLNGVIQGFEFEKYIRKRLLWSIEAGSSIHNGEYPEAYVDQNQKKHDISYRYTVAGIQLAGIAGYSFVRSEYITLGIKTGVLFRYQSSSMPNSLATYYPAGTGLPFPVMLAENTTPQSTYSLGGLIRLFMNYSPNRKISFGLHTGLQGDTNGDVLFPQFAFCIGRSF